MTRKPRPTMGLNPVAKAVSDSRRLDTVSAEYTRAAKINAHAAALALANGNATQQDVALLAAAFNVTALLIKAHGHGAEHATLLPVWRESVRAAAARANGTATLGEIGTITRGLELHDALLETVTIAEMDEVLAALRAHALAGLLVEVTPS